MSAMGDLSTRECRLATDGWADTYRAALTGALAARSHLTQHGVEGAVVDAAEAADITHGLLEGHGVLQDSDVPSAAHTWRTMDSAPRDGTRVLVDTLDTAVEVLHWSSAVDRWFPDKGCLRRVGTGSLWMPLPRATR